jgi:hypothetical protein
MLAALRSFLAPYREAARAREVRRSAG